MSQPAHFNRVLLLFQVLVRREYVNRTAIGRPVCGDLGAGHSPGIEVMYHGMTTGVGDLLQATLKNWEELVWYDELFRMAILARRLCPSLVAAKRDTALLSEIPLHD